MTLFVSSSMLPTAVPDKWDRAAEREGEKAILRILTNMRGLYQYRKRRRTALDGKVCNREKKHRRYMKVSQLYRGLAIGHKGRRYYCRAVYGQSSTFPFVRLMSCGRISTVVPESHMADRVDGLDRTSAVSIAGITVAIASLACRQTFENSQNPESSRTSHVVLRGGVSTTLLRKPPILDTCPNPDLPTAAECELL